MKTWRERIAEARERQRGVRGLLRRLRLVNPFTEDDKWTAAGVEACACAEAADAYGLGGYLHEMFGNMLGEFPVAVYMGSVRKAERLLDRIEDRALALKRESDHA